MRQLIIGGDSFTFGSELSNKSWAELLGDSMGYDNVNVAYPGAGNAGIAQRVIDALPENKCAVAVMWTFTARFDHYHIDEWKTTTVHDTSKFGETFFNHVGKSEYYELHNTLTSIILLQNILEKYNIPYIFTSADVKWDGRFFAKDKYIGRLFRMIDWNKWYFIDKGFYLWGKENYPVGPLDHPLDQAHIDLVKNIKPLATKLIGFAN
jgi:hypothetical protein